MSYSPKKILIVVSDANEFPLKEGDETVSQPSGFFLKELAQPLQKILDKGYEVTFASPEGKEPQPDPNSESLLTVAGNYYELKRENALIERMKKENGFARPKKFSEISDDELESYAGLFIPGGHSPLSDLGDDQDLGRILWHFHSEHKPTAAICHGPYALLSTKQTDKGFAYKGYKIRSWSNAEEKLMETVLRGEIEKVESQLRDAGADMQNGLAEQAGYVLVDKELATGGNPLAANTLGDTFLDLLDGKTGA
ncbi:ThiJ/PfpI family protein [Teratosphaeria destructans]|uniref:D-lactate dehydratase n=1 Tax=Teratosphaeria destructans TaxID=418781 RepID=A0A9W7SS37_9PEZI|nr:ThiJ/PfpI family protein [Teratosphaeria destructans]